MFYQQAQSPAADRGHKINKLYFFLSVCLCQITNNISDFTLDKHETLPGARSSGGGRRRRPLLSWGREEWEEPALCLQPVSVLMTRLVLRLSSSRNQYKCGVFLEELISASPITWLGALPDALAKVRI